MGPIRPSATGTDSNIRGSSGPKLSGATAVIVNEVRKTQRGDSVTFQDHFSRQAQGYTQFRPRYPRELFQYLASVVECRHRAWDCGCGNGQAAASLAEMFDQVIATDPSAKQIAQAEPISRVVYLVATAEDCPLGPDSVDLITVAQALHWMQWLA